MTDREIVAANIARLRAGRQMSQTELAAAMHHAGHQWHQNTVSRVEQGKRTLFLDEADALTEILGPILDGTRHQRSRWGTDLVSVLTAACQALTDAERVATAKAKGQSTYSIRRALDEAERALGLTLVDEHLGRDPR